MYKTQIFPSLGQKTVRHNTDPNGAYLLNGHLDAPPLSPPLAHPSGEGGAQSIAPPHDRARSLFQLADQKASLALYLDPGRSLSSFNVKSV